MAFARSPPLGGIGKCQSVYMRWRAGGGRICWVCTGVDIGDLERGGVGLVGMGNGDEVCRFLGEGGGLDKDGDGDGD